MPAGGGSARGRSKRKGERERRVGGVGVGCREAAGESAKVQSSLNGFSSAM